LSLSAEAWVDATSTNSAPRVVPPSNGLGEIVAVTNPLTDGQSGRPVAHGFTAAVELTNAIGVGSWLAIEADPRLTWLSDRSSDRQFNAALQRAYVRLVAHDVAIEVGTDERVWGQGNANGMLLSANPRPLPAISIGSDAPIHPPGILSPLGLTRMTFMIADLGASQRFAGTQLIGYKVDVMPTPHLTLGFALIDELGGSGAPPLSFIDRVRDLFPYVFLAVQPGSDRQASNKIAAASARYAFGDKREVTLYYEVDPDDFDLRRLGSIYWQDSGHLLGVNVARLTSDGRLGFRVELHRTSLRLYEHGQFTSGVTYRGAILGDPLGPNALGAYPTLSYRMGRGRTLEIAGAYEWRDSSQYTVIQDDTLTGRGWRFVKLAEGVQERRIRLRVSLPDATRSQGIDIVPVVGAERVVHAGFVPARDATNFIVAVSARLKR
jgi:hypothetical protein